MKKIKIKTILILMENIEYGGATTQLISLINSVTFRKTKFIIITNKGNHAVKNIYKLCNNKQIKIYFYNSFFVSTLTNKFLKLFFFSIKPILFFLSIIQMNKILKKYKYDILLANFGGYGDFRSELSGIIAAKILNKKNLFLLLHHCYSKPLMWNFLVNKILSSYIGYLAKGIIFVSHATKRDIKKNTNLLKLSKSRTSVIHNGVDIKNYNITKINLFNNFKYHKKVLMLSRIEPYKGHEDLIDGFSKVPKKIQNNYKIFFVGRGKKSYIDRLKNKLSNQNLKNYFVFYDYMEENSIKILKSADIFFSLTRDFEGFGYSIAESLLAKTPVVATNVGGVVEYLNKKNAVLIKPRDIKKITQIFVKFIKNKSMYKSKVLNGNFLIRKKFNSELMSKKFYKFFLDFYT